MHGVVYNKHWQKRLSSPVEAERDESRKGRGRPFGNQRRLAVLLCCWCTEWCEDKNESHEQVWERSIAEIRKVIPLASWAFMC